MNQDLKLPEHPLPIYLVSIFSRGAPGPARSATDSISGFLYLTPLQVFLMYTRQFKNPCTRSWALAVPLGFSLKPLPLYCLSWQGQWFLCRAFQVLFPRFDCFDHPYSYLVLWCSFWPAFEELIQLLGLTNVKGEKWEGGIQHSGARLLSQLLCSVEMGPGGDAVLSGNVGGLGGSNTSCPGWSS